MLKIGVDIGASGIKVGLVEDNELVFTLSKPTPKSKSNIIKTLIELINKVMNLKGLKINDIKGIGIGVPGSVTSDGKINFACNIGLKNCDLKSILKQTFDTDIKLINDANAATLAEYLYGKYKATKNMAFVTLGSGIGLGMIINGNLVQNPNGGDGELGHMVIQNNNRVCSCGRIGCLETVASKKAIIDKAKTLIDKASSHPLKGKNFGLKDLFNIYPNDKLVKVVLDEYLESIGIALTNLVNLFRPEIIVLGGGISNQKDVITKPLQEYINKHSYGKSPKVKVVVASFYNDNGTIGASSII